MLFQGPDHRRHPRVPIRTTVTFRSGEREVMVGETINLSAGGLLLASAVPLTPGVIYQLRFVPPLGEQAVEIRGLALRIEEAGADTLLPHLTGIRFEGLAAMSTKLLDRACRLVLATAQRGEGKPPSIPEPLPIEHPSPASAEDRRAERRIPTVLRIRFRSEHQFLTSYSTDLSGHGIFLRTTQALPEGSELEMELDVPGQVPIPVHGIVVRVAAPPAEHLAVPGVGVRLIGGDLAAMHALARDLQTPTRLAGALADFGILELVEMMSHLSKSGCLRLRSEDRAGDLHFDGGELVHASCGGQLGIEAAVTLAQIRQGRFDFVPGVPPPMRTIEAPSMAIVLEACRRLDEEARGCGMDGE